MEDVGASIDDEAQITVGDDLLVEASETVTFEGKSGVVAVGVLAVGGSVTSLKLQTVTEAFIDDNAVIAVGDELDGQGHRHRDRGPFLVRRCRGSGAGARAPIQ